MSHAERKRQFVALNRRLEKTDTLPAGVLAKWEASNHPGKLSQELTAKETNFQSYIYKSMSLTLQNSDLHKTALC